MVGSVCGPRKGPRGNWYLCASGGVATHLPGPLPDRSSGRRCAVPVAGPALKSAVCKRHPAGGTHQCDVAMAGGTRSRHDAHVHDVGRTTRTGRQDNHRWASLRPTTCIEPVVYGLEHSCGIRRRPYSSGAQTLIAPARNSLHPIRTLTSAGRPDARARSRAGRRSAGRSTYSPYPPSAATTRS